MVEKEREKEKAKENGEVTTVTESTARELEELPKTIVLRLVKDKLSQLSAESESPFSAKPCRPSLKAVASSSTTSPQLQMIYARSRIGR